MIGVTDDSRLMFGQTWAATKTRRRGNRSGRRGRKENVSGGIVKHRIENYFFGIVHNIVVRIGCRKKHKMNQ